MRLTGTPSAEKGLHSRDNPSVGGPIAVNRAKKKMQEGKSGVAKRGVASTYTKYVPAPAGGYFSLSLLFLQRKEGGVERMGVKKRFF